METHPWVDIKSLEEVHKEVTGEKLKQIVIPKVELHDVHLLGPDPMFHTAVGMSRQWDARKAGREVAEDTLKRLEGKKPDFFLLFSTIHYEKHGGFQELLNGVWEVLPEGTPLIGGTVAGFMNQEGCYTRGATAMAANYPGIEVSAGFGQGTRKTPVKAAKECISKFSKIPEGLNALTFVFMPGPTMPKIPTKKERLIVTSSRLLAQLAPPALRFSTLFMNKGVGREEEVLSTLSNSEKVSLVVGGSTTDNNTYENDFQFFNKQVFDGVVIGLRISLNRRFFSNFNQSILAPKQWFNVTKTDVWNHVVKEIDGVPAIKKYLEANSIPRNFLFDEPNTVHRRFVFLPMVTKDKNGVIHPRTPGTFFWDYIGLGHPLHGTSIGFSSTNSRVMVDSVDQTFAKLDTTLNFCFMTMCMSILETLGANIYKIQDRIHSHLGETPYLLIFTAGEICNKNDSDGNLPSNGLLEMSLTATGV